MKILVTGAGGQVGRELIELATQRGLSVTGFDSKALDITAAKAVAEIIAREQPQCIINAAAYTAVDRAETEVDRAYAINRDGVTNLARTCRELNISLLHISTDYVFDGSQTNAYTESDATNPTSVYGASKLAGEQLLAATWERHVILRVSWVFGQYGNNFVKTMLRLGRERPELNVVNDQFGAPTSARAIAATLLDIATHPQLGTSACEWGVRHFTSDPGVTWFTFAQTIFANAVKLGLLSTAPTVHPITSAEFPTPVRRPANSKLASVKAWPAEISAQSLWEDELDQVLRQLI